MKYPLTKKIVFVTLSVSSLFSYGAMRTTSELKNGGDLSLNKDYGSKGVCIIPNRLNDKKDFFSKGDLKTEENLCEIDLDTNPLCPKLNSTNPGTLILDSTKVTKSETTNSYCAKRDYDVQAKFKQSITCSYTGSALAAYHLSRYLDLSFTTPVAVVRTMDWNDHLKVVDQAKTILEKRSNEIIYKSWDQFSRNYLNNRTETKLFTEGGSFLYGALSENIKKENIYTEVSGVGPYDTRYERFKMQMPYKRVSASDDSDVEALFEKESVAAEEILPTLRQMVDVSDMVILDTLLSQDDRIGNIHFFISYGYFNDKGKYKSHKLTKENINILNSLYAKKNGASKPMSRWKETDFKTLTVDFLAKNPVDKEGVALPKGGILVREMVLKDNDCGVDVDKRSNNMRRVDALEGLKHISAKTYKNIMELAKLAHDKSEGISIKDFFEKTLLYREKDYQTSRKSFMDNLNRVILVLQKNCKDGSLKRDLNFTFEQQGSSAVWKNTNPGKGESCD